jgi:hypothetical protein
MEHLPTKNMNQHAGLKQYESSDQVIGLFNNILFLGMWSQEKQANFSGSIKHVMQGHTEYISKV